MDKKKIVITTVCIGLFIVAFAFIFKSTFTSVATNIEDEIKIEIKKVYEKDGMTHMSLNFTNITDKAIKTDDFYIIIEDQANKTSYKRQIYSLETLEPKKTQELNIQITEKLSKNLKISYQIGEE